MLKTKPSRLILINNGCMMCRTTIIVRQKAIDLKLEGKHDGMVGGWLGIKKPETQKSAKGGRDRNKRYVKKVFMMFL